MHRLRYGGPGAYSPGQVRVRNDLKMGEAKFATRDIDPCFGYVIY